MVLISDGNSKQVRLHEKQLVFSERKKTIFDCSRSDQIPYTDQITDIVPYALIYFWVTYRLI